jgi:protein O-GlcNAc transferase
MNGSSNPEKTHALLLDAFDGIEKELSPEGLFQLALWFQNSDATEKAIECYTKALAAAPMMVEALYNIGVLRYEQRNWPEAISHFKKALDLKPDFVDAAFNLAAAFKENHCLVKAAELYLQTVTLDPNLVLAHHNRALCLQETGNHCEAVGAFKQAISLEPDNALFWFQMAPSILETQSVDAALACYQKAVALKPDWDKAHFNLAIALRLKERFPEAIAHMQQALELNPQFDDARAYLFRLAQHACDWPLMATTAAQLDTLTDRQLAQGKQTTEIPMISIRRRAAPQLNMAVASSWSRSMARRAFRQPNRPVFMHGRQACQRLRIGYLSSDFKDHAVAHQIRGMLATHNRQAFEIFGYAANKEDGTRYRRLLRQACDHFKPIHSLSPLAAAQQIYADGIHILVEMSGHSRDTLLPIAALRPAPLQVSYLGFLGTTGADFIDYVLADEIVVPKAHTPYYSEKIVHLPHCYQANDDRQVIAEHSFNRSQFNLPDHGFVYCCFNQPYKIDENLFNVWMAILKQTQSSVLWLIQRNTLARDNLLGAAQRAGVDPSRLIFTGYIPLEHNLARLQLADLVLDTLTYNGGATTANALWAGVPVLTLLGNHWVSRMSASALHALGMPELIASDLKGYERMAVDWARHPHALTSLRSKLAIQRTIAPLFDTRLFTRHVEAAFQTMWKRHMTGQGPASFAVPAGDPQSSAPQPSEMIEHAHDRQ